ncbi:MAG: methyltransferase domain-containing protein [Bacteroidetes bacterium]|jgi:SAM-dependent methyltransferase|nr:methyltransferase domain-containing protein [Bacteroidota bacterium]
MGARRQADEASERATFWDEKFGRNPELFGTAPNAFVAAQAHRLAPESRVLELGAGEGRNAVFLALLGHDVTVVDVSPVALDGARRLADEKNADLTLVRADASRWHPGAHWDAVVTTFLHLLPEDRPRLWQRIDDLLVPGGLLIGLFFRPEQRTEGYTSGGPPTPDRLVTLDELHAHYADWTFHVAEAPETHLSDGMMEGPAAVVQVVAQKPG